MSLSTTIRRTGIAGMATSLALGACVMTGGAASAQTKFSFDRAYGHDRYATSAKAADAFGKADTVILASGEPGHYPDALAANYLAGLKNAPVLLTKKDSVPSEVQKAISDSGAKSVLIVGGPDVVSDAVKDDLGQTYKVRRIAGHSRFDTDAAVIDEGDKASTDTALLATGLKFPDALGAGPLAFAQKMPLAITDTNDVPDSVLTALKKAGIKHVLVLGGKDVVSDAVVTELKNNDIDVTERFDGHDRAQTSTLLAAYEVKNFGFADTAVNVASGRPSGDGADALGGAAVSGQNTRPLVITKTDTAPGDAVLGFLGDESKTLTQGVVFGGPMAVSDDAVDQMTKAALGSGAQNTTSGDFYSTPQEALAAAKEGDTIDLFGTVDGFNVTQKNVTITGDSGSQVTGGIGVTNADDVTLKNLDITAGKVAGEVAGIYVDGAKNLTIADDVVTGDGTDTGAGVINATGGADEVATISGSTFTKLRQGVFANPSATFTIKDNRFENDLAGSANDTASTITGNTFLNNTEGVGLGAAGSTVTGNSFANNSQDHVGDYTSDQGYELQKVITDNSFDEDVVVTQDDTKIVDKN